MVSEAARAIEAKCVKTIDSLLDETSLDGFNAGLAAMFPSKVDLSVNCNV